MKNILLPLFAIGILNFSFGQALEGEYATLLQKMETSCTSKSFLKIWKKEQKTWHGSLAGGKSLKSLQALTVQFGSKLYMAGGDKPSFSQGENLQDLVACLSGLEKYAIEKEISSWSDEMTASWEQELGELKKKVDQQIANEQFEARKEKKAQTMTDFESTFKKLFEDSFKRFASTNQSGKSAVAFKNGMDQKFYNDADGILTYTCTFKCDDDKELAKLLEKSMLDAMTKVIGTSFKLKKSYNTEYTSSQANQFELNSTRFADVAKKPTASVGVYGKAGVEVKLEIKEPVFK